MNLLYNDDFMIRANLLSKRKKKKLLLHGLMFQTLTSYKSYPEV